MKPQKQAIPINFARGLDTKTDPKQIQIGRFLSLQNSIFTKAGLLSKRNGYGPLAALPNSSSVFLSTFSGNLTAIGSSIEAYNKGSASWINKGNFTPLSLSVLPVARSAFNQTQADSVVASNGTVCTVFTEVNNGTSSYKYVIADSTTGQNIISPTVIPVGSGTVTGAPRVFLLGGYFIIVFTNVITAVSHLQYVAVSTISPSTVTANADIASAYISATTLSWDGVVVGNNLYIAYNTTSGGQQVKVTYLNTSFVVATPQAFASSIATIMSMCADLSNPASPIIYAVFYDLASTTGYAIAVDQNLNKVMTATQIISSGTVLNMTCTAQNGVVTAAWEVSNVYAYDSGAASNFISTVGVTKPNTVTTGTVGSTTTVVRSVGLASKAFLYKGTMYMLAAYDGKTSSIAAFQPTYFLINLSGNVVAKFAYQNGGGYLTTGLPQAQVSGININIAYLYKDLIQSANKAQGVANAAGIYSQLGVNLVTLTMSADLMTTSETGGNLNISGGFLYAYDGNTLNEQDFHLYPDMDLDLDGNGTSKALSVSHSGGSMTTQNYFYVVVYQWTDATGKIFQSAPSIPVPVASASLTGSSNSVTVSIPTCRLTYKAGVKLVVYRWSAAQESYFQTTSITAPTINSTTADVVTFVDTNADASIAGNELLYTTGGVVEDTGTSACTALSLFDTRMWLIFGEDQNLLGYSKQVIEGTPVEMSDLFTKYIDPNAGAQGNTGPMKCLFPMDDKLIILKKNALYYINGTGPDNTGANSQYSEPIFITSTVGSDNQKSIVMIPQGIMFQSDKGIWLLNRQLGTEYIGAPVEAFNGYRVNSALAIPGTNQVRFTLSNGVTLMYDYYYGEWSTFVGVPAISATLYQNLHTYLNSSGAVLQETPGTYLDNGNPVLMAFTTGWINPAGLQGYMRAFWFHFLGQYLTPHKLIYSIAYDYASAPLQATTASPDNFSAAYGLPGPYGQGSPYGGPGDKEQGRIFLTKQRCQAFQISMQEIYDPTLGVPAGAGFTLSGINMTVGIKRGWPSTSAAHSFGGNQ